MLLPAATWGARGRGAPGGGRRRRAGRAGGAAPSCGDGTGDAAAAVSERGGAGQGPGLADSRRERSSVPGRRGGRRSGMGRSISAASFHHRHRHYPSPPPSPPSVRQRPASLAPAPWSVQGVSLTRSGDCQPKALAALRRSDNNRRTNDPHGEPSARLILETALSAPCRLFGEAILDHPVLNSTPPHTHTSHILLSLLYFSPNHLRPPEMLISSTVPPALLGRSPRAGTLFCSPDTLLTLGIFSEGADK